MLPLSFHPPLPDRPACLLLPQTSGKERYVFFSFPHIGIDSKGVVGNISRPGRAGMSCACGAVIKCLGDIKAEGLTCNCKEPGGECALHASPSPASATLHSRP